MFLRHLTADQKASFLALATRMVLADGQITPDEQAKLDALKEEMGGDVSAPAEQIFGNTNLDVFDTDDARIIALTELAVLAASDQEFHADENHVLTDVAGAFGFDPGAVPAFVAEAESGNIPDDLGAATAKARALLSGKG